MDAFAVIMGFAICIAFWLLLTRSMKINGMPWWWRHLSAAFWSPLALVGGSMLVGSLLGLTDTEGEPLGAVGAISGLIVLIPLLLPLWISRRAANRKQSLPSSDQSLPEPEPEPEPELAPKPSREPEPLPVTGNLRFIYRDAEGDESTRELSNFKLSGDKIRGFCLDRNATRTFRLDRVVTFLEGEERLHATESRRQQRSELPDPVRSGDPEIAFSGFDAKTRSELEKTARAHGFVVRKSVTKNLDYFVAGPRRSVAKLDEAEGKPGCSVIDKEGFLWLVATGEVKG